MDRRGAIWGGVLGFALSGFFDGILLHQILQWHHLLSLVPGVGDLRAQVLWDGVFHAGMYVLAVLALWRLWRGAARPPLAAMLTGFGLWHVVDAVMSHWVLGLHRIRLDAASPLAWDLGWLAVFGLLPLTLGLALGRRGPGAPLALLALVALGAGTWAAKPSDARFATVVFRPGLGTGGILAALSAADATLVGGDPARGVIVVDAGPKARWSLYAHGAILVTGTGLPAGCLAWTLA